ncbi:hypothetical protein EDB80DRAFT_738182 [Ilyonectria destructans]|nr:hypothetical protein EDB80DRAFT_738182 [Ilyonectria destructans]
MVSYPAGKPESMVQATRASRATINQMKHMWMLGGRAAEKMPLVAAAEFPYSIEQEVHYSLGGDGDPEIEDFEPYLAALAAKALPRSSQSILSAIEDLTKGLTPQQIEFLETIVSLDNLKTKHEMLVPTEDDKNLWLCYQALIFGFYYKLLEPLICDDFVTGETTYYSGLWGDGSTTFLTMCSQFGQELRRRRKVGRTHVLYMLATMYGGRNKMYFPGTSRINLVGILGSISIVTLPLLRTSDEPQELARFGLLNLPVVQLLPNEDGELYAGSGSGISFVSTNEIRNIRPRGTNKQWSVHSSMGKAFRDGGSGVVMAARCEGRLVGWFSPVAADAMFLSVAYCQKKHSDGHVDQGKVYGFETTDEDWKQGVARRPLVVVPGASTGVVQSKGCPALRYAAAGFYGGAGQDVSIATDDIWAAFAAKKFRNRVIIIT